MIPALSVTTIPIPVASSTVSKSRTVSGPTFASFFSAAYHLCMNGVLEGFFAVTQTNLNKSSLPQCFEEHDGRGSGYVHGIDLPAHRNDNRVLIAGDPGVGQARSLRSHDDCGRQRVIYRMIGAGCTQVGAVHPDVVVTQPLEGLGGGCRGGLGRKDTADAGPYHVRVTEVGPRVTNDDCIDPPGIGCSENSAEVPGFFDRLQNKHQRIGAQANAAERMVLLLRHSNDTA